MASIHTVLLAFLLLLAGCPTEPSGDDDTGDDDTGDDDAGDDDTQGDDDTVGGDDDGSDDDGGDDDTAGDPGGPTITNCQFWIEVDPVYQVDVLLYSVDYTDPQGNLSGGFAWKKSVDSNGIATETMGPHDLPDGPSGTHVGLADFLDSPEPPPDYAITLYVRLSDGSMRWSNELAAPYPLP